MERRKMAAVHGGKRYDTETATLIADDVYWDGHNFERGGRNTWLYRTAKGSYFTVTATQWEGERDELTPVSVAEALDLYEEALPEHVVPYAKAFPGITVEDA